MKKQDKNIKRKTEWKECGADKERMTEGLHLRTAKKR